jgi:hypothetical protein
MTREEIDALPVRYITLRRDTDVAFAEPLKPHMGISDDMCPITMLTIVDGVKWP